MTATPPGQRDTQIRLTWTETQKLSAVLTPSEARDIFGLGGTPDDKIHRRIRALVSADPMELEVLADVATYDSTDRWALIAILVDGTRDTEL